MIVNKTGIDFGTRYKNCGNKKPSNNRQAGTGGNNSKMLSNQTFQGEGLAYQSFYIPFTGGVNDKKANAHRMSKLENIMYYADTPTKNMINTLKKEAQKSGFDKITTLHVIRYGLAELDRHIEDLDSGKKDYNAETVPPLGLFLVYETSDKMLVEPSQRELVKPVIKQEIELLDNLLYTLKPGFLNTTEDEITLSDDLIDSIWSMRKENEPVDDYTFIHGALASSDEITSQTVDDFVIELENVLMQNNKSLGERAPFSEYEKKAENVLKNLSLGTNIFLTFDRSKESPENFLDTVYKVNQKNSDKVTYTELNTLAKPDYFNHVVKTLAKDKSRQHIVAASPLMMLMRDSTAEQLNNGVYNLSQEFADIMLNPPSNVKFLFYDTKNNYYTIMASNFAPFYADFEEASVPSLSTKQMIKSFKENPVLMKDIQKPFSRNAVEKTVEASARLDGAFPEKTQNLMKKIVTYYIDKKDINDKDVLNYLKEATSLFKKNNDDSSVEVIFDTGKKLNDIIGKTSTKKEAAAIVKQIKSNKMGTKGVVIYSQDGSPGSGRRYTAKAIAGAARVPYIEMNTMDFGTKEVDLFGGGSLSPEASMKKLFSIVTTQAEANANKSAVLFIDNFEYFSIGEMISMYHQKAMAQLLREMEKADEAGLNILVIGSVANPNLIGQATMKSFKFVDSMEVASPAFNEEERARIIERALKDEKYKLAGTQEEQNAAIDSAAHITIGFPFIYLKNLIKKAQSVAMERGHRAIEKSDFTEAYLQITTGRPAISKINEHEKLITTSHECGHATNIEVMNNLAKTMGRPWHVPDKVNFVTLDPRGFYGGAVYHGKDTNKEISFEKIFSTIVTSFGGNSAESLFYGMEGSYGISCDMESVRDCAETMVKVMGMGAKTGKMAIGDDENLSDKMKSIIEDDERVIINNAKIASDLITEVYADFNREFTKKYAPLVGTGDCLIDGDEFRQALKNWKARQSTEKQEELRLCDEMLLRIMDCTKKGIAVSKK